MDKYLKVIESLGEVITSRELDITVLKYENEQLKEKVESLEKYEILYKGVCEQIYNFF